MDKKVYAPKKSRSWVFLAVFSLLTLLLGAYSAHLHLATGAWVALAPAALFLGSALLTLVILLSLPGMRYELDDENLVVRCGLLRYTIPVSSIRRVEKQDLRPSLWSSLRLPGLALFTAPYLGVGKVRMCATSSARGVTIIETDRGLYGITPLDEEAFLSDLRIRMGSQRCTQPT